MGAFLDTLCRLPNVAAAARAVGIARAYAYQARDAHPDFAEAWKEAVDIGVELLEQTAHRRASVGESRIETRRRTKRGPGGEVLEEEVIEVTSNEVSDGLLMFLLKSYRPERYRERVDHRHSGDPGAPVVVEVNRVPTRERMRELVQLAHELEMPLLEGEAVRVSENGSEPEAA
jgi:hypothetical protein